MSSGSTEVEPRYAVSFSLKIPSKRTPAGSPTGPYGESCRLTWPFFLHISQIPYKNPLNKEMFPFSQSA